MYRAWKIGLIWSKKLTVATAYKSDFASNHANTKLTFEFIYKL